MSDAKGTAAAANEAIAIFAGGCFWCTEAAFDEEPGVLAVRSGYTGGVEVHPTYKQVGSGTTGHREAVEVRFDTTKTTYEALLDIFWRSIDPIDSGGQLNDRGRHYTTAIYTLNDEQRLKAEASKKAVAESLGKPVATEILPAGPFYAAEAYHQDFHRTNPEHYQGYVQGSGRKETLKQIWQKP